MIFFVVSERQIRDDVCTEYTDNQMISTLMTTFGSFPGYFFEEAKIRSTVIIENGLRLLVPMGGA